MWRQKLVRNPPSPRPGLQEIHRIIFPRRFKMPKSFRAQNKPVSRVSGKIFKSRKKAIKEVILGLCSNM